MLPSRGDFVSAPLGLQTLGLSEAGMWRWGTWVDAPPLGLPKLGLSEAGYFSVPRPPSPVSRKFWLWESEFLHVPIPGLSGFGVVDLINT